MKKIGKKLSYFTKVLLVLGLIFTNLSGLANVFAYEAADNFVVTLSENNDIIVNYQKELDETDVVKIEISETYAYLENVANESLTPVVFEVFGSELLSETGTKYTSAMLSSVLFDGLYEGKVSLYNVTDDVDLGTVIVSENIEHESGLKVRLYDSLDNEIVALEDGTYVLDSSISEVYTTIEVLAGGLRPTDVFNYEETDYLAKDMLTNVVTNPSIDFSGRLFGQYTEDVSVELILNDEETVMSKDITIMYGEYEENTDVLNSAVSNLTLDDMYSFFGTEEEGLLYVLLQDEKDATLLDLYSIVKDAIGDNTNIDFVISNKDYVDVLKAYEELISVTPVTEEESPEEIKLEDFLKETLIDDTTVLCLTSEDLTITYKALVVADFNNDSKIDSEDLLLMINQVVGKKETNIDKSDLYGEDDKVSILDVMYLNQVVKNKSWDVELTTTELETLDARLDVVETDLVSGDEVNINYVLTVDEYAISGVSGVLKYDDTMLELVSVSVAEGFVGDSYEGSFLYLTDEALIGNEVIVDEVPTIEPAEYVVVTATFKTLKSGASVVEVESPEYFNNDVYYEVENEVSELVIVNESGDNSLSSLIVAGQNIELLEDVLEYEIKVGNEVVSSLVEAVTSNIAANITSIVAPEELVEGENTITIVVTAENGDEKVYTVTVVREAALVEEEVTGTALNYTDNIDEDDTTSNEEIVVDTEEDDEIVNEENDEEEGKLSRIIIIILILLVIAGLIYLIFKDDKEDEESKNVNKEINKMKKNKEFTMDKKNEPVNLNKKNSKNKKKGR